MTAPENAKPIQTKAAAESLERAMVQLRGLHDEVSQLAKKSPNDGVNPFKLKLINKALDFANGLLLGGYRPFDDFERFDSDDVPSNSDVTMILAQYLEQAERMRSDHVVRHGNYWVYVINGFPSDLQAAPPTRVTTGKK